MSPLVMIALSSEVGFIYCVYICKMFALFALAFDVVVGQNVSKMAVIVIWFWESRGMMEEEDDI